MIYLITPSTVRKRFKIQLLALSLVVSVHHTSLRFLNLCIGNVLTTVLILRFFVSPCSLYMNLIILGFHSAFDQILILFILPLIVLCYYHISIKNLMVFVYFHMLHLISGITYLKMFLLHQPICLRKSLKTSFFN